MSDDTEEAGTSRGNGSAWKDCAKCESPHTRLGPLEEDCPIVCEDCGAHTEGINGMAAL